MRPYVLADLPWSTVRDASYDVAVLPWGATEPHNLHLPYATDTIQAAAVAAEAVRRAWARGARALVLPAIPFGANAMQLGLGPVIDLSPTTQAAVLGDVVRSLEAAGVPRLVLLNGHGGNDFKPMVRELQGRTDLFLATLDWWRAAPADDHFDAPGDHAGELETSAMLHLRPDLVRPLGEAGDGAERPFRVAALREGWAWAPRDWRRMTADTGVGDPRAATAAKGAAFVDAVAERVASFLVELAAMDPADPYR
ncbi:creatininase family protein [Rubrivirga sp. IMCC45206]|uniref:creatininase family protein n=1 Tax=Rubrivirga sp. IMCC45206 TaxID=3391614 RepID=UPI0039902573